MENQQTLDDAKPIADGKVKFEPMKVAVRQKAMVANLPREGIALIVLGGMHDLGPHLPPDTLYLRVTPASYPGD